MQSRQNYFLTIVSILCIVLVAVVVVQNWEQYLSVTFLSRTIPNISLGLVLLAISLVSGLAVFFKLWDISQRLAGEIKQYELRKEKAEVKAETSSDQVRVLESKIQTLEKALEQALSASPRSKDSR